MLWIDPERGHPLHAAANGHMSDINVSPLNVCVRNTSGSCGLPLMRQFPCSDAAVKLNTCYQVPSQFTADRWGPRSEDQDCLNWGTHVNKWENLYYL